MADPKILYAVVSVVFAGLAVWLAFVFRGAKEPWAQAPVAKPAAEKKTVEPAAAAAVDEDEDDEDDEETDDEDEQDGEQEEKDEAKAKADA